jgi:hypothetical protein
VAVASLAPAAYYDGQVCSNRGSALEAITQTAAKNHKGTQDDTAMQRDELYDELLRSVDALQRVVRQPPDKVGDSVQQIDEMLKRLRQSLAKTEVSRIVKERSQAAEAKSGHAGPAEAPAKRKEELDQAKVAAGRRATLEGTYLPVPKLKPPARSLAGVPNDWIHRQIDSAQATVTEIKKLNSASAADRKGLAAAVSRLQETVQHMSNPPPSAPPSRPAPQPSGR